ncbi:hypothetical protein BDW62DRAFT_198047 [Aspergillus aurantiobrunneus]
MVFSIATFIVASLAALSNAATCSWDQGDQYGAVVCETSTGSPFTSDCANAAAALAARGGHITRGTLSTACWAVTSYHTCAIALCNGIYPQVIDAAEVAFWARTINAECAEDLGNVHSPVSGGQLGVRNPKAGDVQVQLWHTGHRKREGIDLLDEQPGPASASDDTSSHAHSRRAVGQSYNIANSNIQLICEADDGTQDCEVAPRDIENVFRRLEAFTTNPRNGQRVVRVGGNAFEDAIDLAVNTQTGPRGTYISDFSPVEWRRIAQGMMDFRQQSGNPRNFIVRIESIGRENPVYGWMNLVARF